MGIGFKIPINTAKQVMELILTNGSVTRGWIGVEPQNLSKELAESLNLPKDTSGVLISGVLEGGPADKAGIKPGDLLAQVIDQEVGDVVALLNRIAQTNPGDEAMGCFWFLVSGKRVTCRGLHHQAQFAVFA